MDGKAINKAIKNIFKGDKTIWVCVLVLFVYSTLLVYSSSAGITRQINDTLSKLIKHSFFIGSGTLLMIFIVNKVPMKRIRQAGKMLLIIAIVLLLFVALKGDTIGGAARWFRIPIIGIRFQPSELAKISLLIVLAHTIAWGRKKKWDDRKIFTRSMMYIAGVCLIIFMDDFSTSALLGASAFLMIILAGIHWKYTVGTIGLSIVAIILIYIAASFVNIGRINTIKSRIDTFIYSEDSAETSLDDNYQVTQAKIAIGTGGLFGKGPGGSTQRYYLPSPYNDYIFAILLEEYGLLLGGLPLVLIYFIFFYRVNIIAYNCKDQFSGLLVMGLGTIFILQAMINILVAVDLIPVTGQPLPLISWGGTSLLVSSLAVGIILRASRESKKKK